MQQFGSANNCLGKNGEHALKVMVKDHAQQTQQQVNVFASQCANREYEPAVYKHAYNDIKHLLGTQKKEITHEDTVGTLYCGLQMVTFKNDNLYGGDSVSV